MSKENLSAVKSAKNDEFYTQITDINKEMPAASNDYKCEYPT